jgi:RHS repeat-associated protein
MAATESCSPNVGAVEMEIQPNMRIVRESIGGFLLINREIGEDVVRQYRYMFGDHLGSVDLITDENAAVIERMSFDAHGSRRAENSWQVPIITFVPNATLRGYTGHEMLDDLGLIHMNARIYDPELGRFLQADSEVENDATQGLNRYSYVLNNPLSLTDPSGHRSSALQWVKTIAAIVVSVWLPRIAATVLGNFGGAALNPGRSLREQKVRFARSQFDAIGRFAASISGLGRFMMLRSLTSPNAGRWSYRYNAMNEVVSRTDAQAQTISHKIDALGRFWETRTPAPSRSFTRLLSTANVSNHHAISSGLFGLIQGLIGLF